MAERTLRLPCTADFEEEKRESNQPMVWKIEGGVRVRVQGETRQGWQCQAEPHAPAPNYSIKSTLSFHYELYYNYTQYYSPALFKADVIALDRAGQHWAAPRNWISHFTTARPQYGLHRLTSTVA